jgi:hypothetical protein
MLTLIIRSTISQSTSYLVSLTRLYEPYSRLKALRTISSWLPIKTHKMFIHKTVTNKDTAILHRV